MDFAYSDKVQRLREQLTEFMERHVYPAEPVHAEQVAASGDPHHHAPVMEELKVRARKQRAFFFREALFFLARVATPVIRRDDVLKRMILNPLSKRYSNQMALCWQAQIIFSVLVPR